MILQGRLNMLKQAPVVFAVGNEYQIFVLVECESLVRVKCGEEVFYDDSNGIMRSLNSLHKVTVPMHVLDDKKQYTVEIIPVKERKPYFTKTSDVQLFDFSFKPIQSNDSIKILHISDTHGMIDEPIRSAWLAEKGLDLLVLNGDIANSSDCIDSLLVAHTIASRLTNGSVPCVFARGNHDMRGKYAEMLSDYSPTVNGASYYTFRVGPLWGIVLDAGEDKDDTCEEYGRTICCQQFRMKETEFLKQVIKHSEREYHADGVKRRLLISHEPFSYSHDHTFQRSIPIYREWCQLLKEHIKPELALCGHWHETSIWDVGSEYDQNGQPCPIIIGGNPWSDRPDHFIGYSSATVILEQDTARVFFTNHLGAIEKEAVVDLV